MTPEIVSIGLGQLAVGLVFILVAGITSICHALKLERDLLVGTIRTFAQLFLNWITPPWFWLYSAL